MDERFCYSIADVVAVSGVCRTVVYGGIKAGRLKARKLGRRSLILARDFEAWLSTLPWVKSEAA